MPNRLPVILMLGFLLVCALGLAQAKEPTNAAERPIRQEDILKLQADVLDTTRKTAESAIDQSRRVAESAIQSARDTNETLKTFVAGGSGLIAAILAIAAWFGWKEFSALKSEMNTRIESLLKTQLDQQISKANDQTIKRGQQLSLMAAELAYFNVGKARITTAPQGDERKAKAREYGPDLMINLMEIEAVAKAVEDARTLSWTFAERALLYYYADDFEKAVKEQQQAVELNPKDHWDRKLNLACMAARAFERDPLRGDMHEIAKRALTELQVRVSGEAAKAIVDDPDLATLFDREATLRDSLKNRITA